MYTQLGREVTPVAFFLCCAHIMNNFENIYSYFYFLFFNIMAKQ